MARSDRRRGELPPAALRLTLLFLVVYGPEQQYAALPLALVACPMLIHREWLTSRLGWGLLLLIMIQHLMLDRLDTDNHQFLATYWIASVNIALWSDAMREALPGVAQTLIGLTFLFAVAWKLILAESLDGTFWEGMFLVDGRLRTATSALGGIPLKVLGANDSAHAILRDPTSDVASVFLNSTDRLGRLSLAVGIVGVLLESVVAVLFLAPRTLVPQALRVSAIASFFLVYGLLPIIGFAWVLTCLSLAHLEPESDREKSLLVATAGLMVIVQPSLRILMATLTT
jgi:hypothetical protein